MKELILLLIPALCQVESSNNPLAIGDNGKAVGILQIHPILIEDVNRIYGTKYTLEDRKDPAISKLICQQYLTYWGKRYKLNTGKEPGLEVLAKIWNAGPNGWKKPVTEKYWHKVLKELERSNE